MSPHDAQTKRLHAVVNDRRPVRVAHVDVFEAAAPAVPILLAGQIFDTEAVLEDGNRLQTVINLQVRPIVHVQNVADGSRYRGITAEPSAEGFHRGQISVSHLFALLGFKSRVDLAS